MSNIQPQGRCVEKGHPVGGGAAQQRNAKKAGGSGR